MGASVKLKTAQAETCVTVPVSPSSMNLLPLPQICLGVWLLSSDQRTLLGATGILMKYLKSQFALLFPVLFCH